MISNSKQFTVYNVKADSTGWYVIVAGKRCFFATNQDLGRQPRSVPSSGQTTSEPPSLHLPAPLRVVELINLIYIFMFFLHFHQFSSGRPCWIKSWPWLSACFLGGCGPRWLGPLCHGEGRGFLGTLANLGSRWHGQPPAGWAAPCLWFSGALVFWLWGLSWGPSFFFWGANSSYRYVALGLEYFGEL